MVHQRSDPAVREWMREHPDVVRQVEKLYGLLNDMELKGLEELACDVGIDVSKHWGHFKDGLIADIVKAAPGKALEIVLGQSILPLGGGDDQTEG